MKILILPGNAIGNKEWLRAIKKSLNKFVGKIEVIEYSHWKEDKKLIDLDVESEKAGGVYDIVIAKSIGVILALKGIKESKLITKKCVFIGTPINWAKKKDLQPLKYFDNFKIPTLFIQNKGDPTCSSEELKKILKSKKISNYSLLEFMKDTHNYDTDEIIKETIKFGKIKTNGCD